jgi:penicillin-binding protein 1C
VNAAFRGLQRVAAAQRLRRAARVLAGLALAPICALIVAAALEPLPEPLRPGREATSVRIVDRHGRLIREVRGEDGMLGERVALDEVAPELVSALIAAEDERFYWHPGIDPLAMLRAAAYAVMRGHLVSGASTLTQQLARSVVVRPRTVRGKLREIAIALRIEASLGKRQILEEYLNRVEFAPGVRGVEAASRRYFDKPARALDLAEAATLAALPRGPALYDPRRGLTRVRARRDFILQRMRDEGFAGAAAVDGALALPITLQRTSAEGGTHHLVNALASGALVPELGPRGAVREIASTIDLALQREIETLSRRERLRLEESDASALALLVVDNVSSDVLAYVGSPDFFSEPALGQNDGARALRQPGSALKPFVYAAAMQRLGMTAATLLPDVELHLPTPDGDYSPRNYDGRHHGPVRLREALASSLNVPAVYAAHRVGPSRVLDTLRDFGFASLEAGAEHYGVAIALGDGEVRLSELAAAYAALARGGIARPLRFARYGVLPGGRTVKLEPKVGERVLDARIAALIGDVLADDAARSSAFGRESVLSLPFPVSVKTGTSKGFRDNWTVGYTREITVAVWVGNFDGRPLRGSSGVTGAGPLFRDAMLAAMRGKEPAPLIDAADLVEVEVCALSGGRPGPHCTHRVHELFSVGQVPEHECSMHVRVAIDAESGLRAGPACRGHAEQRVFERYPMEYAAWAAQARRPLAPEHFAARCPGDDVTGVEAPRVAFPVEGARFVLDPGLRAEQELVLRASASPAAGAVRFVLDGRAIAVAVAPFEVPWRIAPGQHVLRVESVAGKTSDAVRFRVD